jgi:hypothetical protein
VSSGLALGRVDLQCPAVCSLTPTPYRLLEILDCLANRIMDRLAVYWATALLCRRPVVAGDAIYRARFTSVDTRLTGGGFHLPVSASDFGA